jgi:Ca2+-binding EF-hand superfamily protein
MKLYGTIDSNLATEAKVDRLILSATEEEEGKIDFEQFVNFMGSTYFGTFSRIELRYSFDLLDKDGDGYLSASDLKSSFDALGWSKRFDLKKMLERMDRSGRGLVSFDGIHSLIFYFYNLK